MLVASGLANILHKKLNLNVSSVFLGTLETSFSPGGVRISPRGRNILRREREMLHLFILFGRKHSVMNHYLASCSGLVCI